MSPEMSSIHNIANSDYFDPVKSDIFSLGLTFLRLINILEEN